MTSDDTTAPDLRPHCARRWSRFVVTAALVLPAPVAAAAVLSVAEGDHQVDALGPAGVVFLTWLSVPAAYGAALLLRQRAALRVTVALVAAAASLVVTLWVVRSQAPTGEPYTESLSEGSSALSTEVATMLEEVAPGRVEKGLLDRSAVCADTFGRDRDAAVGVVDFDIDGGLSLEDLDKLVEVLRADGWDTDLVDVSLVGGAGRRVEAHRNGYHFRTWGTFVDRGHAQPTSVEATTPCLRR